MVTINTILNEMKHIPNERLNEIYQFVHSLNINYHHNNSRRNKIMSFAGLLNDMTEEEYSDFIRTSRRIRQEIPERHLEF